MNREEMIEKLENSYCVLDEDRYIIDKKDYEEILSALKEQSPATGSQTERINMKIFDNRTGKQFMIRVGLGIFTAGIIISLILIGIIYLVIRLLF